jgi:hypothetical protein
MRVEGSLNTFSVEAGCTCDAILFIYSPMLSTMDIRLTMANNDNNNSPDLLN